MKHAVTTATIGTIWDCILLALLAKSEFLSRVNVHMRKKQVGWWISWFQLVDPQHGLLKSYVSLACTPGIASIKIHDFTGEMVGCEKNRNKYSLGIQSPCQMMFGVYNHLLRKVFRFHYHSQKVIGSLGTINYKRNWHILAPLPYCTLNFFQQFI